MIFYANSLIALYMNIICWWVGISNYVYSPISLITKIYMFLLYFVSVSLLIMWRQPASIAGTITSTAVIAEVTRIIRFYQLGVLCIWVGISNYVYSPISLITKIYMFLLYFVSVSLLIMWRQPASIAGTITSTAVIAEVTRIIRFYQLGVLCIFDINIVFPYEMCKFIWILI